METPVDDDQDGKSNKDSSQNRRSSVRIAKNKAKDQQLLDSSRRARKSTPGRIAKAQKSTRAKNIETTTTKTSNKMTKSPPAARIEVEEIHAQEKNNKRLVRSSKLDDSSDDEAPKMEDHAGLISSKKASQSNQYRKKRPQLVEELSTAETDSNEKVEISTARKSTPFKTVVTASAESPAVEKSTARKSTPFKTVGSASAESPAVSRIPDELDNIHEEEEKQNTTRCSSDDKNDKISSAKQLDVEAPFKTVGSESAESPAGSSIPDELDNMHEEEEKQNTTRSSSDDKNDKISSAKQLDVEAMNTLIQKKKNRHRHVADTKRGKESSGSSDDDSSHDESELHRKGHAKKRKRTKRRKELSGSSDDTSSDDDSRSHRKRYSKKRKRTKRSKESSGSSDDTSDDESKSHRKRPAKERKSTKRRKESSGYYDYTSSDDESKSRHKRHAKQRKRKKTSRKRVYSSESSATSSYSSSSNSSSTDEPRRKRRKKQHRKGRKNDRKTDQGDVIHDSRWTVNNASKIITSLLTTARTDSRLIGFHPHRTLSSFLENFIPLAAYVTLYQNMPTTRIDLSRHGDVKRFKMQNQINSILEGINLSEYDTLHRRNMRKDWNFKKNKGLGTWIMNVRGRKRLNTLRNVFVTALNDFGFHWNANEPNNEPNEDVDDDGNNESKESEGEKKQKEE